MPFRLYNCEPKTIPTQKMNYLYKETRLINSVRTTHVMEVFSVVLKKLDLSIR